MQTNKPPRSRHVQSMHVAPSRYMPANNAPSIAILAALCLLLPPVGVMLVWRARRMAMPLRIGLSAAGFLSTTLIFFLLMRPSDAVSNILPTPVIPSQDGYGTITANQSAVEPEISNVPAQPDAFAPQPTEEPRDPGSLTDDSTVYAVTNNASSYHLNPICDLQENHRSLTLREALNEGLAPCEKCIGAAG